MVEKKMNKSDLKVSWTLSIIKNFKNNEPEAKSLIPGIYNIPSLGTVPMVRKGVNHSMST
jgi:hypothetical protein